MKSNTFITVILAFVFIDCFAQAPLFPENFSVTGAMTEDGIRIIWTPLDIDMFDKGISKGYSLKRYIIEQNGIETPLNEISATEIILASEILPLPSGDPTWLGDYGQAADKIINYINPDLDFEEPNLADAFTFEQENTERFQFGVFVSFLDFEVAQQMGLAYHDTDISNNTTYMYKLEMLETGETDIARISTKNLTEFPEIVDLDGESENGKVKIRWPIEGLDNDYFSFNILRSDDGINFQKVNAEPYIYFQTGETEPTVYEFQDKTTIHGKTYHYSVEGITVLGVTGKPSESIEVLSKPHMTNVTPIVKTDVSSEEKVAVNWVVPSDDPAVRDFIQGYKVYRSTDSESGFKLMTPQVIQHTEYVDVDPFSSAYYVVATVDKFDKEYKSLPEFAQIKDSKPPEIPFDLQVRESATNQYELEWMANEEEDLEGYLIYTQYAGSENYVMITKDILTKNSFIFNYPPDLVTDEICFKISAIDQRGNESEMSDCVTVVLPDNLPPATPHMSKHQAIDGGIALGWKFSTSDDVAYHELERKRTGAPAWEAILKILPEEEVDFETDVTPDALIPTCYIDKTYDEQRSYDYRLVAVDGDDNKAFSSIVSVTPIGVLDIGQIVNFTVSPVNSVQQGALPQQDAYTIIEEAFASLKTGSAVSPKDLELLVVYRIITADELTAFSTMTLQDAYTFLQGVQETYWTSSSFVTLAWEYQNLDQLLYFQIYRSMDGRGFIDYIDILPEADKTSYTYDDSFIKAEHQYIYQIMAVHAGGTFSEISEPILVRVQ